MARLNNDPKQQKLASLFAVVGESESQGAAQAALVIEDLSSKSIGVRTKRRNELRTLYLL